MYTHRLSGGTHQYVLSGGTHSQVVWWNICCTQSLSQHSGQRNEIIPHHHDTVDNHTPCHSMGTATNTLLYHTLPQHGDCNKYTITPHLATAWGLQQIHYYTTHLATTWGLQQIHYAMGTATSRQGFIQDFPLWGGSDFF